MTLESRSSELQRRISTHRWMAVTMVLALLAGSSRIAAQSFNSGSDGSDGAFVASGPAGTIIVFDPSQFHGTQVSANIFNFTTITIQAGVTVRMSAEKISGPVTWLAQGDVSIAGVLDLSGGKGQDITNSPFLRIPATAGAGGYGGGVGGDESQLATSGGGPGGGVPPPIPNPGSASGGGTFSGNTFLIPLVGGSGGGGGSRPRANESNFGTGGGAGGGAILIASSTQITVSGGIWANGGSGGSANGACCNTEVGGGGSGGAIRIVASTILGSGSLFVNGGLGGSAGGPLGNPGSSGQIRLEGFAVSHALALNGNHAESTPFPLLLPTTGPPGAKIVTIDGKPISPNLATFPDVTINTVSPVDVVIQTKNIPSTAVVKLTILN
jgi:hypothetical protein